MTEYPTFEAVVFDMDGVIFDTEKLVQEAWQVVADKHNIKDVKDACTQCLGLNQPATRERFKEIYGQDFPYDEYKAEMRKVFYSPEFYGDSLPLKTGALEILKYLRNNKIPTALATSTRKLAVYEELEEAKIKEYFDVIICGDMVENSKPNPEIFLKACSELGVDPIKAFVVEDSFNGIKAAHAGGMLPIMVPDMVHPSEEIVSMTYKIFSSLTEFQLYIEKIKSSC